MKKKSTSFKGGGRNEGNLCRWGCVMLYGDLRVLRGPACAA